MTVRKLFRVQIESGHPTRKQCSGVGIAVGDCAQARSGKAHILGQNLQFAATQAIQFRAQTKLGNPIPQALYEPVHSSLPCGHPIIPH